MITEKILRQCQMLLAEKREPAKVEVSPEHLVDLLTDIRFTSADSPSDAAQCYGYILGLPVWMVPKSRGVIRVVPTDWPGMAQGQARGGSGAT